MLMAVWLVYVGSAAWAFPVLAYVALIKPPAAILAPLIGLAFLRGRAVSETLGQTALRAAVVTVGCVALLLVLLLPFDVGLLPIGTRWTLLDRLTYAADPYQFAWLNQFSLWGLSVQNAREWVSEHTTLLGLTYGLWGVLLFAASYAWILRRFWRRSGDRTLLWAVLATTFVTFMLITRMHSRYLFPVIPCLAVAAAITPKLRWLYATLSATFLANLLWNFLIYIPVGWSFQEVLPDARLFIQAVSLVNVGLLWFVLFRAQQLLEHRGTAPGLCRGKAQQTGFSWPGDRPASSGTAPLS
jgi:hypothetical protein